MLKRLSMAACIVAVLASGSLAVEVRRSHLFSADGRFPIAFSRDSEALLRDVVLQVYDVAEKRWVGDQFFVLTDRDAPVGEPAGRAVFRAEAEGTYYLRCVAVNDAGVAEPGDPADSHKACDIVAVHDATPPAVELVEPVGGETFAPGAEVQVLWSAEDRTPLARDSVDVEFSSDGGATWSEVAGGCPPVGSIRWKLPAGPAGGYRVRVTAVDRAGNEGADESAEFRLLLREDEVVEMLPEEAAEGREPGTFEEVRPPEAAPGGAVLAAPGAAAVRPEPLKKGDRAGAVKLYRKGVVYLLRGDYDEAAELLSKAVELDPTFVAARVDLSVAYANDGRFRKARTLLQRSAEIFPEELAFRYNLGRLHYRESDFEAALRHLGAALSIDPGHVESLWLIGDIHAKREELESARHYWQEVIENASPGNRWREKATVYLAASYGSAGAGR